MAEPVIQIKQLCKTFNNVNVLQDVDLDFYGGEVHALLGENGAGKSTVVNILGGMIKANGGSVSLRGTEANIGNPQQARALGMNIIYQEPNLFEHYSVGENILCCTILDKGNLSAKIFDQVNKKQLISRAQKIIDDMGFDLDAAKPVGKLNYAQKRMVEMVRAFAMDSDIIIMDEPTASITQKEKEILFNNMTRLKVKGVAIVFVTQLLEDVLRIADRVSILRDGKKQSTVTIQEFKAYQSEKVIRMISGEDYRNRYPKLNTITSKTVFEVKDVNSAPLHDINFSLHRGEILGITGLVGSGRSLLAKCIFGYIPLSTGRVFVNQKEVRINSPYDAMRNSIAYIPDDRAKYGIFKNMNIRENLAATHVPFLRGLFINWTEQNQMMTEYLGKIEVKMHNITDNISTLSEGNKQKVMLLKWFTKNASIFIFDEPTAGIDTTTKVDIYNLMADLLRKGASIILLSSDLNELLGLSDRILIMSQGTIIKQLTSKDVQIKEIYEYVVDKRPGDIIPHG